MCVCVHTYRCIIDTDYSIGRTSYSLTECFQEEGAGDKGKKESSLSKKPTCWASSLKYANFTQLKEGLACPTDVLSLCRAASKDRYAHLFPLPSHNTHSKLISTLTHSLGARGGLNTQT